MTVATTLFAEWYVWQKRGQIPVVKIVVLPVAKEIADGYAHCVTHTKQSGKLKLNNFLKERL
jgi:hypothetical protein